MPTKLSPVRLSGGCATLSWSRSRSSSRNGENRASVQRLHRVGRHVAGFFGKGRRLDRLRTPDFERHRSVLPGSWEPTTTNNHLRLVRVLFKYANDIEATERAIRYQIGVKSVPKPVVRKHEANQPVQEFTAAEIHAMLRQARQALRCGLSSCSASTPIRLT